MADRYRLKTVTYKAPHTGRRAALCLLLAALILGVSWQMRDRIGLPLSFSLSGNTARQRQEPARGSREITLSAHTLYALQLGAFTQQSAAEQLAQAFSARGAAGYVSFDGEAYRVLAAAYPTRAEAQTVQTRLNAQSISTYIHPITQDSLSLRAGGTKDQVAALAEAAAYLDTLGDKLYTLSAALDAQQISGPDALAALLSEGVTCAALRRGLLDAFDGAPPDSLSSLIRTLGDAADIAEAQRNENSAVRIGAALKRCQLIVFVGLLSFCRGVSA